MKTWKVKERVDSWILYKMKIIQRCGNLPANEREGKRDKKLKKKEWYWKKIFKRRPSWEAGPKYSVNERNGKITAFGSEYKWEKKVKKGKTEKKEKDMKEEEKKKVNFRVS